MGRKFLAAKEDLVEKIKNLAKKADLVLCIGDFGGSEELLKIVFKYLGEKWWEKVNPSQFYFCYSIRIVDALCLSSRSTGLCTEEAL